MNGPGASLARYAGTRVVLLTQHGKEGLLGPILQSGIGCRVERVSDFDTDRLGTFTREIPRFGSQLDAARRKAHIGMELGRSRFGLASEGTFGVDPYTGLLPWNVELVLLIDQEFGLEFTGVAHGVAPDAQCVLTDWNELEAWAAKLGFPAQHLMLRPNGPHDPRLRKGIADRAALAEAFAWAAGCADAGEVFVESDLRAQGNPARQGMIRRAAEDLVVRMRSGCPACGTPGYWMSAALGGLPCEDCGAPTAEIAAHIWSCLACSHREQRPLAPRGADPARCTRCNP